MAAAVSSTERQPYGLWPSPLTPAQLSSGVRLSDMQWDSDGCSLVWRETRSGRGVLRCLSLDSSDAPRDLTDHLSVRASVGYGGGDFTVGGGTVFFTDRSGCIYRQPLHGGMPRLITPAWGNSAAMVVSPVGNLLLYVHSAEGVDCLAVVDAEGQQWPQQLVSGHDFYMQPRWHPDGQRIAYVAWNHPQMPWDGTTLYLATLSTPPDAAHSAPFPILPFVVETVAVAGSPDVAIFQPEFSPDGRWLAYVSDGSGWSNIYLYDLAQGTHHNLTRCEAEHGIPAWVQGLRTYGWSHDSQSLLFVRNKDNADRLCRQHIESDQAEEVAGLNEHYSWLSQPAVSPTDNTLALIASSSTQPARLIVLEKGTNNEEQSVANAGRARIACHTTSEQIDPALLSEAEPVSWQTAGGAEVHGLLYRPMERNGATASSDQTDLPPAIISIHGGPTGQADTRYNGEVQFFTTRGYIVLRVNHRGSTGYGRAYMEALRGRWGVFDVEDTVSGARYLAEQGIASSNKLVIMGGSSGGYTVLETLCRAPGTFKAAICMYGISDLLALVADTHKFESRYLDSLLGPLPQASAIYRERSPLFHAHLMNDPIAIFQGSNDPVVPQVQSDAIVESLRTRGVPHEYHLYEGEEHGWRKQETIETFYRAVEAFLKKYVLFA